MPANQNKRSNESVEYKVKSGSEDTLRHIGKFCLVGQGGGMTAAYHIGVTHGLIERFPDQMDNNLHRVIASSGAAAIYSFLVSGQVELQQPIFEYLFDSKKFVKPFRYPPGKGMMDIDFMVDNAMKPRLDIAALKSSPIEFDVGVTDSETGKAKFIEKNSPQVSDPLELIRASCMVPYFSGDGVKLGNDELGFRQYLDGTIGSVAGVEEVKDEENVLIVLTRPLDEPLPQRMLFRKMAARALMEGLRPELQAAIWGMMTQVGDLPERVAEMQKHHNVAVIEPSRPLPMWRIELRPDGKERLIKTIEQGYEDTLNNVKLEEFFKKI